MLLSDCFYAVWRIFCRTAFVFKTFYNQNVLTERYIILFGLLIVYRWKCGWIPHFTLVNNIKFLVGIYQIVRLMFMFLC